MSYNNTLSIIALSAIIAFTAFAADDDIGSRDRIKYIGDLTIEQGEVVNGDVIVMQGDLRVLGTINGNAIVSLGNTFVDSGGVINGDLIAWKGKIFIEEGGFVAGEVVESRLFDISLDDPSFRGKSTFEDEEDEYSDPEHEPDVDARLSYNKVDGFFLGLTIPKKLKKEFLPKVTLHGFGGYGFSNKRWQYNVELDKWFFKENILEFGIEIHGITDTEDNWIIQNEENSLAAFFLHEDFRDYFYRRGVGAHISQEFASCFKLKLKYLVDDYAATENNTNWALFGGNKDFTPNFNFLGEGMNIREGLMRSLDLTSALKLFGGNLIMTASAEKAGGDEIGGDFEFTRFIFETRGYFDIDSFEGLNFRLKLGSSQDDLPYQKYFTLGGISTLRGFSHKEFYGKQMALLNLEYRLFSEKRPSKLWLLKLFQFAIFTDIGSTHPDIFKDFDIDYYKNDVGLAIMTKSAEARLDIARRTDTGYKPWVLTFRIEHPF